MKYKTNHFACYYALLYASFWCCQRLKTAAHPHAELSAFAVNSNTFTSSPVHLGVLTIQ